MIEDAMFFDPWGARRNATTWQGLTTTEVAAYFVDQQLITTRGYAGHEMVDGRGRTFRAGWRQVRAREGFDKAATPGLAGITGWQAGGKSMAQAMVADNYRRNGFQGCRRKVCRWRGGYRNWVMAYSES